MWCLESFTIYQEIKECSNQWLNWPNGSDDSNINVSQMRIVHCQEYAWIHSYKQAALYEKPQTVHPVNSPAEYQVVRVPAWTIVGLRICLIIWHLFIAASLDSFVNLCYCTEEDGSRTHVENSFKTGNFRWNHRDQGITNRKRNYCSNGEW